MSTPEQQAMAVERLTFEVEQAKRYGFVSMQPLTQYDGQYILDALAAAQQQVEQYRKRVHGTVFRIEDALMYLDEGENDKVRDRLNEAVATLERNIT